MTPGAKSGEGGVPRRFAYNQDAAREREMHLYLPYWGFSESEKFAQQSVGHHPNVSRDNVLTVFAQLASLRLEASRALISLFDRTTQHVVAEATPHLGLRSAKSGQDAKCLWRGVQRLPRDHIPMCDQAMSTFVNEKKDMFLVSDLKADPRFQSHNSVTGPPHHRFYVSVPIKSLDEYVIGSIAVLDDKPRDSLTDEQHHFLQELSLTVMDHLLSQRAMREEYREEKMVRALGLFVQGKSDLSEGIDSRYGTESSLNQLNAKLEQFKLSKQKGTPEENDTNHDGRGRSSDTPEDSATDREFEKGESTRSRSPVHKFKVDEQVQEQDPNDNSKAENAQRPSLSPTTSHLQKSLAPSNVQSVLNRASCLMNQALDVEGAMFIDATVYARRQMIGSDNQEGPESVMSHLESEDHELNLDDFHGPKSLVLGYSTSENSSRDNDQASHYVSLPGAFVSYLIDKYPRGKIFHIEKDGSVALSYEGLADDVTQNHRNAKTVLEEQPKEKNLREETLEIRQLHKILPEARCIAIYPVWDFQRSRWFTVNLVWSNDPGRVLSEPKDLTYMAAFSNSVMAEVSRMDIEAADRAKSDFISSISHELRSPLHGVLGTVELLQETATTFTQRGLVETVYSCGRTLLDTLNHLLDYAKINTMMAGKSPNQDGKQSGSSGSNIAVPGLVQDEDLSILVQEVVEGLLAGAEFYNRESSSATEPNSKGNRQSSHFTPMGNHGRRIMTIVDIERHDSWRYPVYAGAWRRVVMNLFGNALKYTQAGYIRLFMKKCTMTTNDKQTVPAICLTISDSGRGMSQDFLLHHLYIPFLQEDTQAPGLGVGLHLVHQIVKSLNGKIEFRSEVGKGTDVDVILPVPGPKPGPTSPSQFDYLRERLEGMTVSLFTQSLARDDLGIRPDVFEEIRTTLSRMVSDWFGLKVLGPEELKQQDADFLIVTEHEYRSLAHDSAESDVGSLVKSKSSHPLIVLSAQASSWRVVKERNQDRALFLSQPVSPKTMATVFEHCLDQDGIPEASTTRSGSYSPRSSRENSAEKSESGSKKTDAEQAVANIEEEQEEPVKKVLLVEDNNVNLKIIETCVRNAGLAYESAVNGLQALEKFKGERFDAVVMDISMPIMDGLTATREMRMYEKSAGLPRTAIIILTAVLSADMQQEAQVSGVDKFLTKPTPLKKLRELLQNLPNL
ncbi:hypothetical protein POX_a00272 [Penicillium oxalicum]|uniref:hypothetical protein n=1 Tax=Penicillium oxalicum TaxID=69781 RepID=UPI0020B76DFF|nr:hypothetical protein POX_a00272 [Penicillium oxalicum]KAI2793688.1 hypothetical protein POX_a00272 [Penicillium oxalicum]